MKTLTALIFATLPLLLPHPAFGWGTEGHQTVAYIAAARLSSKAATEVKALLGPNVEEDLVAASTWADEIRPTHPETGPWHYVDIPVSSNGYDAARDCPKDNCVVAQIHRFASVLKNKDLPDADRAIALKFLVHLVGDIHQPLHAANNDDKGGNAVHVTFRGNATNLHHIWDTEVVGECGACAYDIGSSLQQDMSDEEATAWEQDAPEDWANQSFRIAKDYIYGQLPPVDAENVVHLPDDYAEKQRTIVRLQLERAGVRLANVINQALS